MILNIGRITALFFFYFFTVIVIIYIMIRVVGFLFFIFMPYLLRCDCALMAPEPRLA